MSAPGPSGDHPRPTLDDLVMSYAASTIRDAEEDQGKDRNRRMMQMMSGARR